MLGVLRHAIFLCSNYIRVDLIVPLTRGKEGFDKCPLSDVRSQLEEILDVLIEVCSAAVGDVVGNVRDRTRHER
jgi:hypothetical protein